MDKLEPLAVSAPEAARLLGVSKPTVYQMMNREDFPAFKVGARTLISVEGLRERIRKQVNEGVRRKKKPALLVAQQNGRRKRGRLHGRTPLPKTIVHQTRTGRKRDIFLNFYFLGRDKVSIFGIW